MPRLTPEQYLEIERAAEFKSEYFDGQMYAMAGGTFNHAAIIGSLYIALGSALRGRPCRLFTSDLRVRIGPGGLHTYPDTTGVCGEPRFADDYKDTLTNPVLIVEVLSKSTEAHDRGFRFREYRKIESLREYALVSQTAPLIEVFSRGNEGEWTLREFSGPSAVSRFSSIDCTVNLGDIYRDLE